MKTRLFALVALALINTAPAGSIDQAFWNQQQFQFQQQLQFQQQQFEREQQRRYFEQLEALQMQQRQPVQFQQQPVARGAGFIAPPRYIDSVLKWTEIGGQ